MIIYFLEHTKQWPPNWKTRPSKYISRPLNFHHHSWNNFLHPFGISYQTIPLIFVINPNVSPECLVRVSNTWFVSVHDLAGNLSEEPSNGVIGDFFIEFVNPCCPKEWNQSMTDITFKVFGKIGKDQKVVKQHCRGKVNPDCQLFIGVAFPIPWVVDFEFVVLTGTWYLCVFLIQDP